VRRIQRTPSRTARASCHGRPRRPRRRSRRGNNGPTTAHCSSVRSTARTLPVADAQSMPTPGDRASIYEMPSSVDGDMRRPGGARGRRSPCQLRAAYPRFPSRPVPTRTLSILVGKLTPDIVTAVPPANGPLLGQADVTSGGLGCFVVSPHPQPPTQRNAALAPAKRRRPTLDLPGRTGKWHPPHGLWGAGVVGGRLLGAGSSIVMASSPLSTVCDVC